MPISLYILLAVLIAISLRKFLRIPLRIWQIMLIGAVLVLLTQQISVVNAFKAINFNIIGYLFGVFVIGQALEESGYMHHLCNKLETLAHSPRQLLFWIIFGAGFGSALLMNDTIAIIATPMLILVGKHHRIHSTPLLLSLAFAVSIGSIMSPIGNPQNLLIAIGGNMQQPFADFLRYLFIPTVLNLFIAYWIISWRYKNQLKKELPPGTVIPKLKEKRLSRLTLISKVSLSLMIILISFKTVSVWMKGYDMPFSLIALTSCAPILLFSQDRFRILKRMDWATLIFFAALFILMQAVWDTGFFQTLLKENAIDITSKTNIMSISVILSQFISNVPLVALYLPMLMHHGIETKQLLMLAAGSTMAGCFLIIGAASNIIIIQNAEKRGKPAFHIGEFMLVGIPIGLIGLFVYWCFL